MELQGDVIRIKLLMLKDKVSDIAKKFNVSPRTIRDIKAGEELTLQYTLYNL